MLCVLRNGLKQAWQHFLRSLWAFKHLKKLSLSLDWKFNHLRSLQHQWENAQRPAGISQSSNDANKDPTSIVEFIKTATVLKWSFQNFMICRKNLQRKSMEIVPSSLKMIAKEGHQR